MEIGNRKIGVIGCGNMGTALIRGLISRHTVSASQLLIYDNHGEKTALLAKELSVRLVANAVTLAEEADLLIIAVKPKDVFQLLESIKSVLVRSPAPIVVSVVAGVTTEHLQGRLNTDCLVVRAMPNLPALVGSGMTGIYVSDDDPELRQIATKIFSSFGEVAVFDREEELDVVTSLAASGPAFACLFIEALADGGVKAGLKREIAQQLAVQAVYGAADMLKKTAGHPAKLKDMIASAGGTTIYGLHALETAGVRGAVMSAVEEGVNRAMALGEKHQHK